MTPQVYELTCNGSLSVCRTETFKSGLLSISFVLPIQREEVWKTSLLLSVLRRGTQKYPTLAAINQRLDYLYGTELSIRNSYRGDRQIIGFSADLLDAALLPEGEDLMNGALDVMCQILFAPLLDDRGLLCESYVESEKKQQCDQIRAQKNNPRGYASDQCRALLYENEPCGASVLGKIEEIEAITPAELTAHWRQLLTKLTPVCFFVGRDDPQSVRQAIERSVCKKLAVHSKAIASPMTIATVVAEQTPKRKEESLPVGQSQLVLGLHTGIALTDKAYAACVLYNELLGASPISKLFMNVREKLSLCYFCSSHYNAYKGTITVHCGLDHNDRARAEEEILAQLRALSDGHFTTAELTAAKQSITNAYRQIPDSPAAIESFYFGRGLVGMQISPQELCQMIEQVSRRDVLAVAKAVTVNVIYYLCGTAQQEADEHEEN